MDSWFHNEERTCREFIFKSGVILTVYDGGSFGYGKLRLLNGFLGDSLRALPADRTIDLVVSNGPLFSQEVL